MIRPASPVPPEMEYEDEHNQITEKTKTING